MREERKFKASHFENIQELIASCIIWIKTDDYDAYCRFFDMGAMEELIKELNNIKEIEKSHKEENGKLRVELVREKEKNKELNEALERSSGRVTELTVENSDLKYQIYHKQQMIDELTQNEENLKIELGKEKEKNKELEKQINFNKKTVEIAQTQILEYSQGYKDGLNKETTATAIVARELELNFIRQEIKHKYISKDKIEEKIRMYKLVDNSVSARTLELLLKEK